MSKVIDISNNQGTINFAKVAAVGRLLRINKIEGVIAKASEGRTYRDPYFRRNKTGAEAHGLLFGAYHFARPDRNTPEQEADNFFRTIGRPTRGDLIPVLDFESHGHTGSGSAEGWARRFNKRFHELTGIWPIFYSYSYFIREMELHTPIGGGLWLADYGRNDGKRHPVSVPSPWRKIKLHQYTSQGRVSGISGNVDMNYTDNLKGITIR